MSATIEGRAVATMVASIADSSVITTSDTNSRRRETARGGAVESEVISGEVAFSILGRDHRRGLVRGTRRLAGPPGAPLEERPLRRRHPNRRCPRIPCRAWGAPGTAAAPCRWRTAGAA